MFTNEQEVLVYHDNFSTSCKVPLERVAEVISALAKEYNISEIRICGNSAFGLGHKEEIMNTYAVNYGANTNLNIEEV